MHIYVEGGGDSNDLRRRCREGFGRFLRAALPDGASQARIVACGSRDDAYNRFAVAVAAGDDAMLLVDSEDPVPDGMTAWDHLHTRDGWDCPPGATEDDVLLMQTSMETWIAADLDALRLAFPGCLQENALLPLVGLESRLRHGVLDALERATRTCGRNRGYRKGATSFNLLGRLNPVTVEAHVPSFATVRERLTARVRQIRPRGRR